MGIYTHPLYYEIAFGFVDPKVQVDSFEKLIKKFSNVDVNSFLDVACGTSLQLREIARRGYKAIGLDSSPQMLKYLEERAREEGLKIEIVIADMSDFRLERKMDFAFIMMGSIGVESDEKFLSHLDSVASSLKKGGLYLVQNKLLDWTNAGEAGKQTWKMEKDGITVEATFEFEFRDILDQIYRERITLEVNDQGERKRFVQEEDLKFIFPQEFRTLVELNGNFEFLGWWKGNCNTWDLDQPLEKVKDLENNIVLLRRR